MRRRFLLVCVAVSLLLFTGLANATTLLQNANLTIQLLNSTTILLTVQGTQTGPAQGISNLSISDSQALAGTTIQIRENLTNGMTVPWTDYHLNVTFSSAPTFINGLTTPAGWTSNMVNNGGNSFTFNFFFAGTPIPVNGTTGNFGFDLYSAAAGLQGLPSFTLSGDPSTATAVPEPSCLMLLGSGMAGMIGVVRRRLKH